MGVVIETRSGPMSVLLAANSTTAGTSIADPADTLVDPDGGAGVIRLGRGGHLAPNGLKIIPFGAGSATNTFLMAVYAIQRVLGTGQTYPFLWTYHLLAGFTCTLCTKAGIANSPVNASQLYCDTITLNSNEGNANVSNEIVQPGSNRAGHVLVDCKGADQVKILFALNGSSTSNNALFGPI